MQGRMALNRSLLIRPRRSQAPKQSFPGSHYFARPHPNDGRDSNDQRHEYSQQEDPNARFRLGLVSFRHHQPVVPGVVLVNQAGDDARSRYGVQNAENSQAHDDRFVLIGYNVVFYVPSDYRRLSFRERKKSTGEKRGAEHEVRELGCQDED